MGAPTFCKVKQESRPPKYDSEMKRIEDDRHLTERILHWWPRTTSHCMEWHCCEKLCTSKGEVEMCSSS